MKFKKLELHDVKAVPDHILEEVEQLTHTLLETISPLLKGVNASVALSAMSKIHALLFFHLSSEDEESIRKNASILSLGFVKNIEQLTNVKILKDD